MVMAVRLPVGRDVHELRVLAFPVECAEEPVGEVLPTGEELFERHRSRDRTVVEEDRDAASGGEVAEVGEGGIDFRSDGGGFLASAQNTALYSFTTAGGGALVGATGTTLDALAFNSANVLYGLTQNTGNLVTVNQSTAALTTIGATGIPNGILGGLDFLNDQTLFAVITVGSTSSLYQVNPLTGQATLVGAVGINRVSGISFLDLDAQQAPEPASLLLVGLAMAAAVRRRLQTRS
jgi:hypothetical protein